MNETTHPTKPVGKDPGERWVDEAPPWYTMEEASAWSAGWDACRKEMGFVK